MAASGGTIGFRLSWRQASTPSAGFGSMLFIGAIVGLVADLMNDDVIPTAIGAAIVVATVLWRRFCWSASVGPDGLAVRRLRRVTRGVADLGGARLVGRASQLRVQVQVGQRWVTLPAPRCLALAGDVPFRAELALFTSQWPGDSVDTLGLPPAGETPLVLKRRLMQVWPWLLLGLADLVWQCIEPTMGADLTLVAIALIVLLQIRQPRPVNSQGLWVGDGDRFVEWREIDNVSIDRHRGARHRGARRILLSGDDVHERLISPVDSWWAPDRTFDCTYGQLVELRSSALGAAAASLPLTARQPGAR